MPPAAPARLRVTGLFFRGARVATFVALGCLLFPHLRGAETQLSGQTYLPLSDVAARYGMKLGWGESDKTMQLQNSYCTIECTVNERSLRLNGQPMALGFPIIDRGGMFYLAKLDFDYNLFPLLSPGQIPGVPSLHRIIIDPGHGGDDPGTQNAALQTNEKTNTLDTGLRLAEELRKRGYEVILTRTSDVTFDRKKRPIFANNSKGDLYLSIHFNETDVNSVSGVETWILTPPWEPSSTQPKFVDADKNVLPGNRFDLWNTLIGFSVERTVTKELGAENRGVKRARYDVLVPLNMPGLLVECGFLSNPTEGRLILTPDYRQKIALALADGIDLYKTTLDKLRPHTPAPPPSPTTPPRHPEMINEISLPRSVAP